MKRFKHLVAILLAALVLMMALPAMATGTEKGSITVENAVNGQTYTLYRILDLADHNASYSGVHYTVAEGWEAFFQGSAAGTTYMDVDSETGFVTWKDGKSAADFAAAAVKYAEDEKSLAAAVATVEAEDGEAKFGELPLGYYLLRSDLGALCSLTTTTPAVTIREKNGKPSNLKEVQEGTTWGSKNDADLTETVRFRSTIQVLDGEPTDYVFHDKMEEGLTFDPTSVTVKRNDVTLTSGTHYTLVCPVAAEGDGCTFEIEFRNEAETANGEKEEVLRPNDEVVIEYSAKLNEEAKIKIANVNKSGVTRKNHAKIEWSSTETFTWQIDVLKFAMEEKEGGDGKEATPLAGAEFVLYKVKDDTRYYATATANEENHRFTGWTADGLEPEEDAEEGKTYATVFVTPESGELHIQGLDSGNYALEEIAAPKGYEMLEEAILVTIGEDGTVSYTYQNKENGTGTVEIENRQGAALPNAGGVGTTMFYILGTLVILTAGVFLWNGFTRKEEG